MILLLGGTSETRTIAEALAEAGLRVLVSTATDIPLATGDHPHIHKRSGRLDAAGLSALIAEQNITLVLDATHPYASRARATAQQACEQAGIAYVTYVRPENKNEEEGIILAGDHAEAAKLACDIGKPVLLTIGVNNIAVYAQEALSRGIRIIARVLPEESSMNTCLSAGLPEEHIIPARGPFSIEDTAQLIRRFSIGVLVTKDSGQAGGVEEKFTAARQEGCCVVMVRRPAAIQDHACHTITDLLAKIRSICAQPRN